VRAGRPLEKLMASQRQRYDEMQGKALEALERARTSGYFREATRVLGLGREADLKEVAQTAEFKRFRARLIESMGGPK
jgi:hypothetical protein